MIRHFFSLLALTALSPSLLSAGIPIRMTCFGEVGEVEMVEDFRFDGFVRAEVREDRPVIFFNPEALSSTILSPTTLEFIFQRECARIRHAEEGFLGGRELSVEDHREIDCWALNSLVEEFYRSEEPFRAERAPGEIQRDFYEFLGPKEWPASLGPQRRLDFERCRPED